MLQAFIIGVGGILGFLAVVGASLFVWDFIYFKEPLSAEKKKEEKLD